MAIIEGLFDDLVRPQTSWATSTPRVTAEWVRKEGWSH